MDDLDRLSFVEDTHTYRVDGKITPSVTQIIAAGGKSTDYSDIPEKILLRAGQIGTRVHKQVELYHTEGAMLSHEDDSADNYLKGYAEFLRDDVFRWGRSELMMFCDCHMYAGTVDLIGTINERDAVVDIKTTNKINTEKVELQTAAYSHLAQVNLGFDELDRYVLHLKKSGSYTLIACDDVGAWYEFEALVRQFYEGHE